MPRYSLLKVFSSIGIFCANTDSLALRWVELCLNIFFQTISRWHPDTGLSSKTKGTVLQGFNVFFIKPESENVRRKPYTKVQNLQPIFFGLKLIQTSGFIFWKKKICSVLGLHISSFWLRYFSQKLLLSFKAMVQEYDSIWKMLWVLVFWQVCLHFSAFLLISRYTLRQRHALLNVSKAIS